MTTDRKLNVLGFMDILSLIDLVRIAYLEGAEGFNIDEYTDHEDIVEAWENSFSKSSLIEIIDKCERCGVLGSRRRLR
jgi:hypothetical protein